MVIPSSCIKISLKIVELASDIAINNNNLVHPDTRIAKQTTLSTIVTIRPATVYMYQKMQGLLTAALVFCGLPPFYSFVVHSCYFIITTLRLIITAPVTDII